MKHVKDSVRRPMWLAAPTMVAYSGAATALGPAR